MLDDEGHRAEPSVDFVQNDFVKGFRHGDARRQHAGDDVGIDGPRDDPDGLAAWRKGIDLFHLQ